MIRKLLAGALLLGTLVACHKSQQPAPATNPVAALFKDERINVVQVSLKQTGPQVVAFDFTTRYEKNIAVIEVMNSADRKSFCTIYEAKTTGESHALKHYSVTDTKPGKPMAYYMIRYTTQAGEWAYSPVYQVALQ